MLINLSGVVKEFVDKLIFGPVTAGINEGDRIGLVGANGAGKTTLINVILGESEISEGELSKKRDARIGYLAQNSGFESEKTVREELRSVFSELIAIKSRLSELSHALESAAAQSEYARLQTLFESRGGYEIDLRIDTVLNGMGFGGEASTTEICNLSGGEKTRLMLAKLLLSDPELLILDEPTNHLDLKTLAWLEDFLAGFKGALLIVSHDRYFLDKTVKTIWELENCRLYSYRGNYTKYKELKEERLKTEKREYEKQQLQIASMQQYAERNIVRASTSQSARSRLKQLENMEVLEKPFERVDIPKIRFEYTRRPVSAVLTVTNLNLTVGEGIELLKGASFELSRGDRVAIVGPNGAGKTTLLRALFEDRPEVVFGRNVDVSYFDQEQRDIKGGMTVMDELWRHMRGAPDQAVRSMLGRVLITGEDAFKNSSVLSGGETARLKLAIMMHKKGNFLILDEPTNHLDLASREALEEGLRAFDGTLVFVSHDRYFLQRLADKIIEIKDGALTFYPFGYEKYLSVSAENAQTRQTAQKEQKGDSEGYYRSKQQRSEDAKRKKHTANLISEISKCEDRIAQLEALIASPEASSDFAALSSYCDELEVLRTKCDQLTEEWLEISDD